ncbi:hypothetical protein ANCDUO_18030 [Ancylostoma duodenale]|uniref:Uncharacterized protein n=1 Tax=Ancylostoma duodenale TaxID=51022 RepID=A0A0C2FTH8_9BILA|nr:hypothetical protein ANCDUO_18030 [Ancylostoma duodenale]
MDYDDNFTIKVYDLGGHERIRDIWTNYYAENCRRGVCEKLTGRTRCECIFCGDGKSFPLDVLVNLVGGALLKKG